MFRLPEGWSKPKAFDDVIVAGGIRIRRSGVSSIAPTGEEVCGAAAARSSPTRDRAWFELAERACIVSALAKRPRTLPLFDRDGERVGELARRDAFPRSGSRRWAYTRSNGVALHRDWTTACGRARAELAERDRLLRSWLGAIAPRPIALDDPKLASSRRYEVVAVEFRADEDQDAFAPDLSVVGVFGFPRRASDPLALGFAARSTLIEARASATAEALQLLAFLWGAPIPDDEEAPSGAPSASIHLDRYQTVTGRSRIRRWIEGGHRIYAPRRTRMRRGAGAGKASVHYLDLSCPWLGGELRVAKAISKAALPFGFGELPVLAGLPSELRIHPIP